MADIDKTLPNTRTKIDIPTEEEIKEVSVEEEIVDKPPVEVIPEEDGGATLDFATLVSWGQMLVGVLNLHQLV